MLGVVLATGAGEVLAEVIAPHNEPNVIMATPTHFKLEPMTEDISGNPHIMQGFASG